MTDVSSADTDCSEPVCPTCLRTFETVQGMRVHHTKTHGDPLPNRTCIGCDESFYDERSELQYCPSCTPNEGENNPNWRGGKTTGTCVECGTEFEYYPSEKPGRYCPSCVADESVICTPPQDHWGEGSTMVRCQRCDSEFTVYRSKAENQNLFFCDRECYTQWLSETMREGFESPEGYGLSWKTARKLALERDNHSCQRCGVTKRELGQNPDVHHITPVRKFDDPSKAHTADNLVCLCRSCHLAVEWYNASFDEEGSGS